MTTYKVSELTGYEFAKAVAKAEGMDGHRLLISQTSTQITWRDFRPDELWQDAGPIIERERISLTAPTMASKYWVANAPKDGVLMMYARQTGETALIAAMRAFVASKFGEKVEI